MVASADDPDSQRPAGGAPAPTVIEELRTLLRDGSPPGTGAPAEERLSALLADPAAVAVIVGRVLGVATETRP